MANVNVVTREKVEALIREQVTPAIFQDTPKESVVLSLGKKLPNKNQSNRHSTNGLLGRWRHRNEAD